MHRGLLALMLAAGSAQAAPGPADTFDVAAEAGYRPVPEALAAYLDDRVARTGTHRFCVVGYRLAGTGGIAWVYWHEGQRLVHWEPAGAGFEPKDTLLHSRRDLDLRRDVVATARELAGSSYRIDRPWLRRLLADCHQRGRRFTVHRR